jgi:hypothetical protein
MAYGSYNAGNPANSGGWPQGSLDRDAVKFALQDRAEDLFQEAWGQPARAGGKEWRARDSSARSMVMQGPERGWWFDFEAGIGGDIFDFYAVEFCGLSRANDDFPRVLREAAAHCGLADGPGPDLDAMRARKAAQEAQAALQDAADTKRKAALVQALQARSEPLTGSPAAAYLASRGIHTLPKGWSYLPPVHGLGLPSPHRPALVAWAVDAAGQVTGGQRVLILEDGRKAPEDPRKVGFGSIGGSPARIPAQVEGGPLCIAEGPETAAAIAQATGFEVWAVFGVGGFETAPAPLDRQVILCPDQDAPGSPAAKAFDAACDAQARRGVDLWTARAPEPKGSKRDLADTLQDSGREAVGKALAKAVKFTPRDGKGRFTGKGAFSIDTPAPMPDFLDAGTAREMMGAKIAEFLETAAQWQEGNVAWAKYCKAADAFEKGKRKNKPKLPPADMLEGFDPLPPVLAIAASPGAGKSTVARAALAQFNLSRFGGDVVFYLPTLKLAEEAARDAGGHVTRGRTQADPMSGQPMCERFELAEAVGKAGLNVHSTLCERKLDDDTTALCPHFHRCRYLRQWAELPPEPVLRFEAHAYLSLNGDGSGREVGLRVIDESVWRQFAAVKDLPVDKWVRARQPVIRKRAKGKAMFEATETAADATAAAQAVLNAMQRGQSPLSVSDTAEDFREFAQTECGPNVLNSPPSATDDRLLAELADIAAGDAGARLRARVWQILADCKERGLEVTERLRYIQDVPCPGKGAPRDVLRATWLSDLPRDKPVLLLDADISPGILQRIYPDAERVEFSLRPNAEVLQLTDKTFSKAATLDRDGKDNRGNRRELVDLVRAEVYRDRLQGARGVLAIATKALVQVMFEEAGHKVSKMSDAEARAYMMATKLHGARWLWFGPSSLGLNTWQDFGTAVVIGREELPLDVLEDQARAVWGDTGAPLQMVQPNEQGLRIPPRVLLPVTMADGSGYAIEGAAHPEPRTRELQEQGREYGARQAFERLRLANATERKRVVLASAVPIPGLPVDQLVTWQELAPDRLDKAIAEAAQRGAVLRVSAAGLAQDAPETFPTVDAARDWLKREGTARVNGGMPLIRYTISGAPPLNPVRVRLKLPGQRGPIPTPALVILPGNPRELAEAQFGPLAMFEVVEPPELSLNAVKECPASLKAGKETEFSDTVKSRPPDPEPVLRPGRRLVLIPEPEQIDSPLMAGQLGLDPPEHMPTSFWRVIAGQPFLTWTKQRGRQLAALLDAQPAQPAFA